jgi:hypothetical protein
MITFEYRFDMLPGKRQEFLEWAERRSRPVWLRMQGMRGYRAYHNVLAVSTPQRVIQVDVEDLATLERIFTDEEFVKLRDEFHGYVCNVTESMLSLVFTKEDGVARKATVLTFEYRFDVVPGKRPAFLEWVERRSHPFFVKMPEVLRFRVYHNVLAVSTPQRVIQVDVEDLAALQRIFTNEGFVQLREEFHGYVYNVTESILSLVFAR